jgi:phospholipase D-like protein
MARKQRWSELAPWQRRAVVAVGIVQVSLSVAAFIDIRRRPARRIRGPKRLWTALSFTNTVGPVAYFAYGRRRP